MRKVLMLFALAASLVVFSSCSDPLEEVTVLDTTAPSNGDGEEDPCESDC